MQRSWFMHASCDRKVWSRKSLWLSQGMCGLQSKPSAGGPNQGAVWGKGPKCRVDTTLNQEVSSKGSLQRKWLEGRWLAGQILKWWELNVTRPRQSWKTPRAGGSLKYLEQNKQALKNTRTVSFCLWSVWNIHVYKLCFTYQEKGSEFMF